MARCYMERRITPTMIGWKSDLERRPIHITELHDRRPAIPESESKNAPKRQAKG